MNKNAKQKWSALILAMSCLVLMTFTPLIMPAGQYKPMFLGLPYTLWTSIAIVILMVILTYIGTRLYSNSEDQTNK